MFRIIIRFILADIVDVFTKKDKEDDVSIWFG